MTSGKRLRWFQGLEQTGKSVKPEWASMTLKFGELYWLEGCNTTQQGGDFDGLIKKCVHKPRGPFLGIPFIAAIGEGGVERSNKRLLQVRK